MCRSDGYLYHGRVLKRGRFFKGCVSLFQRDVVTSYLESGKPVDEQGVEDAFELLHEIPERVRTGVWVGDCFIYNNSAWRLNYCVGGEVSCDLRGTC